MQSIIYFFMSNITQCIDKIYQDNQNSLLNIKTEATTIDVLIKPILEVLGYDSRNIKKMEREFCTDIKGKNGQKVDIVLKDKTGKIVILVECKSVNEKIEVKGLDQLKAYFNNDRGKIDDAKIAILTNGLEWKFYTDIERENILDDQSFFEFNLKNLAGISILEKFSYDGFDLNSISKFAKSSKYITFIKAKLHENYNNPTKEFVQFLKVFNGQWFNDEQKAITKTAFNEFIHDMVALKIKEVEN